MSRPPGLLPKSLTARLITGTVALVTLVSLAIGAVTTVLLHHFLIARLDDQARTASTQHAQAAQGPCPRSPGTGRAIAFGQSQETVLARFDPACSYAFVLRGDQLVPLTNLDAARLQRIPRDTSTTVTLSVGDYRVVGLPTSAGLEVTGLPTSEVSRTISSLILREVAIGVGCVVLAGVGAQVLIRRQLSPLRRVAATARQVTNLPLESGQVGVTARVPPELTDESTEVGQVGASLNQMLGHVERALDTRHESEQRMRRFLADASHELRTPLSTILGYAELTRRTADDPQTMTHAMNRIQAESGRMAGLVNDLLLLARLDSGRALDLVDVDLSALLVESVSDARVVGPEHLWRIDLPEEPLHVMGDRDRLHQVIANLLSNAFRHTPPGTTVTVAGRQRADVDADRPGDHRVELIVHDDGPGLPESLHGKEFERFSRADTSRTRASGGTGLGLSIVHAIVTAHGGTVSLHSRTGSTTITVRLPSAADDQLGR